MSGRAVSHVGGGLGVDVIVHPLDPLPRCILSGKEKRLHSSESISSSESCSCRL